MNLFDWYFRQIVNQSEMDQAFVWGEEADWDLVKDLMMRPDAGGNEYGGILDGGAVTEQAVPDLTVQVSAISAFGKSGERIKDETPSVNVDVSQDEYGTSTAVTVGGESRIISVFARFKRNPTTPAVDGNGLTVYTRQLESMEYFVRMGTSAVTPTPPPLLSDALLLKDITRANGQMTIQNTDMDDSRREDWIRFSGAAILSDFIHGTAKSAFLEVFQILDLLSSGGATFSFTDDWWNSQAVQGSAPPITSVGEALNAIVYDLSLAASPEGAQYIGKAATTGTPGGYCDYAANSVAGFIGNLCTTLANHISGGAPQHSAVSIGTGIYDNFRFIYVTDANPLSGSGDITNASGGEGIIIYNYDPNANVVLIQVTVDIAWNTFGNGVDDANPFVSAECYINGTAQMIDDIADGSNLQTVLEEIVVQIARRPDIDDDHVITGDRNFQGQFYTERNMSGHNVAFGYGDPDGAIAQMGQGNWNPGSNAWPLGGHNNTTVANLSNLVDICRAWDFVKNRHAVLVVGDETRVGMCTYNVQTSHYITDSYMFMTNVAGTKLEVVDSNYEAWAICSNGRQIFVLVGDGPTPGPPTVGASIYCYDAAYWEDGGNMRCLWATSVGTIAGLTTRKTDCRIIANTSYVWALLSGENCATQTPLVRMNTTDGLGVLRGKGEGSLLGGTPYPSGGLCMTGAQNIFYTCHNGTLPELVPATAAVGSTGFGIMTPTNVEPIRDICVVGQIIVMPNPRHTALDEIHIDTWDWVLDAQNVQDFRLPLVDHAYYGSQCSFDGTRFWITFVDLNQVAMTGEMRCVASIHAGQFIRYSDSNEPTYWPRFMINKPRTTDFTKDVNPGDLMGRCVAWGPGLFYLLQEASDNEVNFMPLAGLY
jgi:hypothetical protein